MQISDMQPINHNTNSAYMFVDYDTDGTDTNDVIIFCRYPAYKSPGIRTIFTPLLRSYDAIGWCPTRQLYKLRAYNINPHTLLNLAIDHEFEIHESVYHLINESSNAHATARTFMPYALTTESGVVLNNAPIDAVNYFNANITNNIDCNQFLAKTMGYPVLQHGTLATSFDKVVSSSANMFWTTTSSTIFDLYNRLHCKICIVVDHIDNFHQWVYNFTDASKQHNITQSKIKVCHREPNPSLFNTWIADNQHNGSMQDGDIFIFDKKPAKWIHKDPTFIKIVVSTRCYPDVELTASSFIKTHQCVIFLSDIKPTMHQHSQLEII